jgi:hypothetical protein
VKVSTLGGDDRPHPPGQRRNVVKQRQRREVIAPAGVVAPPFACADEDAAVVAGRRLADLDVDVIVMQGDFAADGDYVECPLTEGRRITDEARGFQAWQAILRCCLPMFATCRGQSNG